MGYICVLYACVKSSYLLYLLGSRFESDVDPFADDEADEECEEIMESTNPVCIVAPLLHACSISNRTVQLHSTIQLMATLISLTTLQVQIEPIPILYCLAKVVDICIQSQLCIF